MQPPPTTIPTTTNNDPTSKFSIVDLTDEVKLRTQLKGDKILKVNKQFRSNTEFQANYFFFKTDKNDRKKRKNSSSHSVVTPTEDNHDYLKFASSQFDAAIQNENNNDPNNPYSKYSHKRRNTISGTSLLQTALNVSGLHHDSNVMNQYYNNNNQSSTSELNNDHPLFVETNGSDAVYNSNNNHSYNNDSIYTPTKVVRVSSSYPNNVHSSMGSSYGSTSMMDLMDQQQSHSASSTPRGYNENNGQPTNQRVQSFGGEFDFFSKLMEMEGNNSSMFHVGGQSDSIPIPRQRRASIRRASVSMPKTGSSNSSLNGTSGGNSGANTDFLVQQQQPSVVNMNSVDMSQLSQSFNYQQFKQRYTTQQPIKIPQPKGNKTMRESATFTSTFSCSPASRTPVSSHSSNSDAPMFDLSSLLLGDVNPYHNTFNYTNSQQENQQTISSLSSVAIDTTLEDSMAGSFESVFLQEEEPEQKPAKSDFADQQDEIMDEFLSIFLP